MLHVPALLLALTTQTAQAGNGATVLSEDEASSQCFEWSWGGNDYEYCIDRDTSWHMVETPSGNELMRLDGEITYEVTINGALTSSTAYDVQRTWLLKDGDAHVFKYSSEFVNFVDNDFGCWTAYVADEVQIVNGALVRHDSELDTVPCE